MLAKPQSMIDLNVRMGSRMKEARIDCSSGAWI